jgi:hypothetical protein
MPGATLNLRGYRSASSAPIEFSKRPTRSTDIEVPLEPQHHKRSDSLAAADDIDHMRPPI